MTRCRTARSAILAVLALSFLFPAFARGEQVLEVRPGGLVQWEGEGIRWCGMQGKRWSPRAEGCWFAIDLLVPEGSLELARGAADGTQEIRTVRVGAYPYDVQRIEIKDDSKVNLSSDDIARSRRESARVGGLWATSDPARFELPLGPPLADLPAGGRFGSRRFFNGQPRSPHSGADYAASTGTPVLATARGRVVLAADHFFSGKSVFLDHGDGLVSMYFHLSEISVEEGMTIDRGTRLGAVGATGRATGPHLHFGLRWHGARVDPALLMRPETIPAMR